MVRCSIDPSISDNLLALYAYCQRKLTQANINNDKYNALLAKQKFINNVKDNKVIDNYVLFSNFDISNKEFQNTQMSTNVSSKNPLNTQLSKNSV